LQYTPFSRKLTGSLDQISKTIQENAKVIDLIQEVALELTTSISTLHALTVKYASIANAILDGLLPIVRGLPIVPKKVLEMLVSLESITQKIIDNEVETTRTINNVKDGLTTGDVSKLQGLNDELQVLTKTLTSILPK
jgi:hypothetical protein